MDFTIDMRITSKKTTKTRFQFNKIIMERFCSTNAYYHLGESYLNTDKKQQALMPKKCLKWIISYSRRCELELCSTQVTN
jgi:hypothetical protein